MAVGQPWLTVHSSKRHFLWYLGGREVSQPQANMIDLWCFNRLVGSWIQTYRPHLQPACSHSFRSTGFHVHDCKPSWAALIRLFFWGIWNHPSFKGGYAFTAAGWWWGIMPRAKSQPCLLLCKTHSIMLQWHCRWGLFWIGLQALSRGMFWPTP